VPTSSIAGKEQFTKSATQLIRPVEKVCWSKFLQSLIETKQVCLRLQITSPSTALWIFRVLRMNSRWIETQFGLQNWIIARKYVTFVTAALNSIL
jgi:hypothetical protein